MSPAARRLVVFDWDGTLVDSLRGITATARAVLLEFGFAEEELGDLTRLVGPPFPQAYSQVYGLSDADAAEVTRRYRSRYEAGTVDDWPIFEGIRDLLARLRLNGRLLAIASSKRHGLVMRQVGDNGIAGAFDAICGKTSDGDDTKEEAILRAISQMDGTVDDAVMVGDRDIDVHAAAAVGVPCVGVLYGKTAPRSELVDAGAVAIAETVAELEALLLS